MVARRERRKQDAFDVELEDQAEQWKQFAVAAAAMRAGQRFTKELPSGLTKAIQPLAQRRYCTATGQSHTSCTHSLQHTS